MIPPSRDGLDLCLILILTIKRLYQIVKTSKIDSLSQNLFMVDKMKTVYPDYLEKFTCTADKCTHCCCHGWEIDIDDDTYKKYMSMQGPVGSMVRSSITGTGVKHFMLNEKDDCPLLNDKGLCTLCLTYGEESLCCVCHMYPRFVSRYGDTQEMSLSMSCEEAARIIISNHSHVHLTESLPDAAVQDNNADELSPDDITSVRQDALHILQNDEHPITDRACAFLMYCEDIQALINDEEETPGNLHSHLASVRRRYLNNDLYNRFSSMPASPSLVFEGLHTRLDSFDGLEILGDEWKNVITKIHRLYDEHSDAYLRGIHDLGTYINENEIQFEQILVYFTTRYFMRAVSDCDIISKAKFAVTSLLAICDMMLTRTITGPDDSRTFNPDDLIDICRIYSGEVEHSEDNIETINDEFLFGGTYETDSLCRMIRYF